MKKLILFSLLLWTLCQTSTALAHAVVTNYSLKVTPIHVNQESKVELFFNSKVELGLSQIYLVSKGDKHQLLTATSGDKQGQVIVTVPALAVGDYAIRLKIFAADGHLTEDVIHFSVTP
jgi:methionine-rich copper-binding protein CopC